ncbi:MAG: nicotinate (nicotinamide) nucleotide adenylyltransferase, partial [Gammaproteobacteria bacterium]
MKTIGILGGTFDPIHKGHLQIAEQVLSQLGLDEIHFMPCANPVHRDMPRANNADRLQMIKLAIAGHPGFRLNTLELDRGGQSYMIDTLRQICDQGQFDRIYLVLGADAFNIFHGWKSPHEILALANLVICRRPGIEFNWSNYSNLRVDSIQALKCQVQEKNTDEDAQKELPTFDHYVSTIGPVCSIPRVIAAGSLRPP